MFEVLKQKKFAQIDEVEREKALCIFCCHDTAKNKICDLSVFESAVKGKYHRQV